MVQRREVMKFLSATAAGALMSVGSAWAAADTVTLTIGYAAGGPGEVLARKLTAIMQADMGKTIVVKNKPGAGGMLAVQEIVGGPTDGSAMIFSPPGIVTTQPIVNSKMPYDPAAIEPMAGISTFQFALAVPASHPAKNLKEWVSWAQKQDGGALYGVMGMGNMMHFIGHKFGEIAKVKMEPVSYNGAKLMVKDLLGGGLQTGVTIVAAFGAMHDAGKIRVLGVTGPERSASLPNVPTFKEQGFDIVAEESFAFYGPKGVSAAAKKSVYDALTKALKDPGVLGFMGKLDFKPMPETAEAYQQRLNESVRVWGQVAKDTGFKVN